jgi:hypothetical protein
MSTTAEDRSPGHMLCTSSGTSQVRRAKLFVFLRLHRHELFDELFQSELAIPRTVPKPVLARMLGALLVFQGGGTY